ncbi:MAG TPA: tetratricopeptide repeat protein [Saprospiraceae bacterium]|nr:tetratricopeptide repeat protein [Saprospiraceae bacterium]
MKSLKKTQKLQQVRNWIPKGISTSHYIILLFSLAILLYCNTLGHDFVQDDAIVITDNAYTIQGVQGIPGIFTKDTFFGFFKEEGKEKIVSGGRYRPLSLAMFALEIEIFGLHPAPMHAINILLYALLCILIFYFVLKGFQSVINKDHLPFLAFMVALVYLVHPVHTEVVANIKGRDELLALLFSLSASMALFSGKHLRLKIISLTLFYLALLSKENAIMMIPGLWLFYIIIKKKNFTQSLLLIWPLLVSGILFIIQRSIILGPGLGSTPLELMNNPFIRINGNQYEMYTAWEKGLAIAGNLGYYVKLLIWPHPLTNDYYPYMTGHPDPSRPMIWLSISFYALLLYFTWILRKKSPLIAFATGFFLITLFIYSNIPFPIGTNLSERFLFIPSLGFSILAGFFIFKIFSTGRSIYVFGSVIILLVLCSFKTVTRNTVWKDNFTLYTTDVKVSGESAKALNAAGGVLVEASVKMDNDLKRIQYLETAERYLRRAVQIHPNYKNAWLLLGNAHFYKDEHNEAIEKYEQALRIDPGYQEAKGNLAFALRSAGRYAGEQQNDLPRAIQLLLRSHEINPTDTETIRLLGVAEGIGGNHDKAVQYFYEMVRLQPEHASGYVLLSQAYRNIGNEDSSNYYRNKAMELDPNAFNQK